MFKHVFFDLDGTLSDSQQGICGSIQYALRKMKQPHIPEAEELRWCIGPALRESFRLLLGAAASNEDAEQAVVFYRERFTNIGIFENKLYDGIPETLAALQNEGRRLYMITAKPIVMARRIIDHFDLRSFFHGLYGSELDGKSFDKALLTAEVLRRENIAPHAAVFVGDRRYDIEAAHANALPAIAAAYGYASQQELEEAKPEAVAHSPRDIPKAVRQLEQQKTQNNW
jgi:phosphoglycolate phosphatase